MQTHWIGHRAVPSAGPDEVEVTNPADGSVLDTIPAGDEADVARAVEAAREALPEWQGSGPSARRDALAGMAAAMAEERDEIAAMLVAENGKPMRQAVGEVESTIRSLQSYAELAIHFRSGMQSSARGDLNFQHRVPRGVVGCVVPWNYPLSLGLEKVGAALAVGNTVVLKPSERTPLTTRWLAEHSGAGLPAGVFNVVLGLGSRAGEALLRHPGLGAITFVGSEAVGRHVAEVSGRMLRKAVLELGGKDAFIVDDSADLDLAVRLAVNAKFTNAGQICNATERILVHRAVAEEFSERFVAAVAALRVGPGDDPQTDVGPLIDPAQRDKVAGQVAEAVGAGARVLFGGSAPDRPGYYYAPTVLADVPASSAVLTEETFGPVAPIEVFDDFSQGLRMANDTTMGLAAVVCTRTAAHALRAIEELVVGTVRINAPRGRTPGSSSEPVKASGYGHGSGLELMEELSVERSVLWRVDERS